MKSLIIILLSITFYKVCPGQTYKIEFTKPETIEMINSQLAELINTEDHLNDLHSKIFNSEITLSELNKLSEFNETILNNYIIISNMEFILDQCNALEDKEIKTGMNEYSNLLRNVSMNYDKVYSDYLNLIRSDESNNNNDQLLISIIKLFLPEQFIKILESN